MREKGEEGGRVRISFRSVCCNAREDEGIYETMASVTHMVYNMLPPSFQENIRFSFTPKPLLLLLSMFKNKNKDGEE
jgi:hypothetical protein